MLCFAVVRENALSRGVVDIEGEGSLLDGHVLVDNQSQEISPDGFINFGVLLAVFGGSGVRRTGGAGLHIEKLRINCR